MPHNIIQTEKKVSEQCVISNIIIIIMIHDNRLYKDKVHNDHSLINFA